MPARNRKPSTGAKLPKAPNATELSFTISGLSGCVTGITAERSSRSRSCTDTKL